MLTGTVTLTLARQRLGVLAGRTAQPQLARHALEQAASPDPDPGPDPDPDSDADAHPDPHPDAHPDPHPDAHPDAGPSPSSTPNPSPNTCPNPTPTPTPTPTQAVACSPGYQLARLQLVKLLRGIGDEVPSRSLTLHLALTLTLTGTLTQSTRTLRAGMSVRPRAPRGCSLGHTGLQPLLRRLGRRGRYP